MSSRDRLKDIRAQQQQQQGGYAAQPYGQGYAQQPYAQQQDPYAQTQYGGNAYTQQSYPLQPLNGAGAVSDDDAFFAQIDSIREDINRRLDANITKISDLHSRRLTTTDDHQQSALASELAEYTQATSELSNELRARIKALIEETRKLPSPQFEQRKQQIEAVQQKLTRSIQDYQSVESKSREKYRQRMERQMRIVKPDATASEIKAALDDSTGSGGQVFSQALMNTRQSGARSAYAEVQSRQQDLQKIESTLIELAQMMNDMSTMVLEQDQAFTQIETAAGGVQKDMEAGHAQVHKGKLSALAARKKRWICFFIIVIIVLVLALVLGLHFGLKSNDGGNNNNRN